MLSHYWPIEVFTVLIMVKGQMSCIHQDNTYSLEVGDTILIPADCSSVQLEGKGAKFLEVYL